MLADPKLPVTLSEHKERELFLLQVMELQRQIAAVVEQINTAVRDLTVKRDAAAAGSPERAALDEKLQRLTTTTRGLAGGRGGVPGRLSGILGAFSGNGAQQGSLYPPTGQQRLQVREARTALDKAKKDLVDISR